jgi:bifunctional DNase/RNase
MELKLISVSLRNIVETPNGASVFFSCKQKVFAIHMSRASGESLIRTLEGRWRSRPLTHNLMNEIFTGFGVRVACVILYKEEDGVFFAKMALGMQNEIGTKLVEVDARPSDALVLAAFRRSPVFVTQELFNKLDDMSEVLEKILKAK